MLKTFGYASEKNTFLENVVCDLDLTRDLEHVISAM